MAALGNTPVTHTHKIHEAVGPAVRNTLRYTNTTTRKLRVFKKFHGGENPGPYCYNIVDV